MRSRTEPSRIGLTTCARQFDIASFLLGALTPPDERELMTHAAACRCCQATLHEFGTLPDLLALVPPSVTERIDPQREPALRATPRSR
jgi:hypothetical protein